MSANSSGSGRTGGGSSPQETKPSTSETGEVTGGSVDNACNNQTHSTTHRAQSPTNHNLTGESDTHTPEQAQSKGEISMSGEELTDDKEKREKKKITPSEEEKFDNEAVQRAENDNQSDNNYTNENVCAGKRRGTIGTTVPEQDYASGAPSNSQAENHNQESGTPSNSQAENHNQESGTPSNSQAENPNQDSGTPSNSQAENHYRGSGTPSNSQAENPNQDSGTPSNSQAENLNQDSGTPSNSLAENHYQGSGTPFNSQAENHNQGSGTPSNSQAKNQNQESGTPSNSQAENPNQESGTPSNSQAENHNQGSGTPSNSQAKNPNQDSGTPLNSQAENNDQGSGTPSILQAENHNKGNGTQSNSQTENHNQGSGTPSNSQAENPNQDSGTPSNSQAENPNQDSGTPSNSLAENHYQESGTPSNSQAENPNQGNGTPSNSLTENHNQGSGTPSNSQAENTNQDSGTPSNSLAENHYQGSGTPFNSQAENHNQGSGTPSNSQAKNQNQESGTPSNSQAENPNQESGTPSNSQAENHNQGSGTPSNSQAKNPNQDSGTPLNSQAENNDQGSGTPSILQAENHNKGNGTQSNSQTENHNQGSGTPSNSQAENPNQGSGTPFNSQAENPNQGNRTPSASQTKSQIKGNGTPSKSQAVDLNQGNGTQSNSQVENPRKEIGKPPTSQTEGSQNQGNGTRSTFGISELQAGILEKSDRDSETATTEEEDQYAIAKTQLSQSGTQVRDYTSGQIKEGATRLENPEEHLSICQSQAVFTVIDCQLQQKFDEILTDSTQEENKEELMKRTRKEIMAFLSTTLKDETLSWGSFHPYHTHSMPIQLFDSDIHVAGTSKRDAEGARAEDGVSSSMHTRPNDPTKYTKEPHDEKSQLSGQTTSLLKSPERGYSKSLYETRTDAEGARAEGGVSSSMHTRQSARQTGNGKDGRTNPVTDSQLPRSSSGPEFLRIQLNKGEETEGSEKFEISLYSPTGKILKYIVQITCKREDFSRLKFMFNNGNTIKDLANMLLEVNYSLKSGTQEINLDSKSFGKNPQKIQDEIEGVINTLLNLNNIHVLCTPVSNIDEILVEKCQTDNPDCREGNVVMHLDDLYLWIVGQDEEELEKLRKIVTSPNFIPKGDTSTPHKVVISQPDPVKDFAEVQDSNTSSMGGFELSQVQKKDKSSSKVTQPQDNLVIALGGKEMKFGPLMIGSSQALRPLEIHCSKEDFYKLLLIFDSESFRKKDALIAFTGKIPAVIIVINHSFCCVDEGVQHVENFLKKILPTVTSSCRRNKHKVVDLYREEVLKCFNGDVKVYYDEDDNTCLWFVSEEKNVHLINKAIELLGCADYFEKVSNDPPSHDSDQTLIAYSLSALEVELCKKFNIAEALRGHHGKTIKDISIDENKSEFKISVTKDDESAVRKDIKRFLDVKKETKLVIKEIPKRCINFLKLPAVKREICTEMPYYVHVQNEESSLEVYSDTEEHAKKIACIIEGLFLQEKVDLKDFDTGSDTFKIKEEEWRKEFSDLVGIDLTAEHIEIWGLRRCVEKILSQLENDCKQNTRATSLELNGEDEINTLCCEGEIPFSKEDDVKYLESKAFQKKIAEIQDRHKCLIKLDMENAFPFEKRIPNGWSWYFQNGQRVSFENSEVKAVQPNQTSCIVKFLPLTQQTKSGINLLGGNTTHSKNMLLATVALPVWRDGKNKEKEYIRNCFQLLFQSLHDQNISTVFIPLMMDSTPQWSEKLVLKSILYWRRHFMDLTVFCHPDKDKYTKLLPTFQELKDEPEREKICIRIEKRRFTDVKVQVLVNTVGWDLKLKMGHVSNSILLAAGDEIQLEANKKFPNGLLGGEVLVTDAYKLRDRGILKVFHGSLLQWKDFESIAAIKSFVAKCLCLATEYGMTSIAFPALGTGNLGYEHSTVAKAMFETVRSFMEGSVYTSVKEVVFNVFDEKSIEAFCQEEKKYLNNSCESGTFLPQTYWFPDNNLTFELYFGEVWARDVKGLVVFFESSEIFKKDEKICIAECGKLARSFDGKNTKQQLKSGQLDIVKIKVWRPVKWVFCLTWQYGRELEKAVLALKSVEEEKLDSVAFAISKKDGVAGQLPIIIKSVFAATKQIKKGSPLRKVIIVVEQALSSAACKIVEDHFYEIHNIQKKRCRMSFTCNSQNSLQNAKAEVISALDSLKEASLNQNNVDDDVDDDSIDEAQYNQRGKNVPSKESAKSEAAKRIENENEIKSLELRSAENCSLILSIINEEFLGQELEVLKQRLHEDVLDFSVPVKIIFPFLDKRDALLKFDTHEDLNEFKKCFRLDYLQVKDFPTQAVMHVNATVSQTAKEQFDQQGWTTNDITERSGVTIKNLNDRLVLEGSLLEIQAAREFIKDACLQCKASAKEKEVPKVNKNNSLDYDNAFVIQQTKRKFENELSHPERDKTEFEKGSSNENSSGTKKPIEESGKFEGALHKPLTTESVYERNQFTGMNDLSTNVASVSASPGKPVELQEPANQSIRQKERVYIPYLEFEILKNLFPFRSDITNKVNIFKKDVVEVVGNHDAVQPFREAIAKIEGYQKIAIHLKEADQKNFYNLQKSIQSILPNVLVLLFQGKMHIVSHENNPELESLVRSVISQSYRNGDHIRHGQSDPGSNYNKQREQISSPVQKTTLGKQVFQHKGSRVFVQPGDVFCLENFDCLVNPTNEYLDLKKKGGLSAAVNDRAGGEVQSECRNIIKKKRKIEIGKCVSTTAGNLKYKRIIHTIVRPWKEVNQSKFQYETVMQHIQEIVKGCLALASDERMTSIVFPAIGSGQSAIPPIVLANGYRLGCVSFNRQTTLREIFFVIENSDFLSLVERTFLTPLPWCVYWEKDDEYTYYMSEMCKVVVANRDVLMEDDVDALVVLEDPFMSAKGKLAAHVLNTSDEVYKKRRRNLTNKNRTNGSAAAITYSGKLKYKTIVQITMEDSRIKIWRDNDVKLYKNCILEALKLSKSSIAMQLYIGRNTAQEVMLYYAKALSEAVAEHIAKENYPHSRILISNTDRMRHQLVKEEFNRLIRQACNSNAYFERVVFLKGQTNPKSVETQL